MKHLLIMFAMGFALSSCKESSPIVPDEELLPPSIVGNWTLVDYREEGTLTFNNDYYASYWNQSTNITGLFEFKDDDSYSFSLAYDYDARYTYFNGQVQDTNYTHPQISESGTYSYSETSKKLRLLPSTGKVEYEVSLLSEDSLHFSKPIYYYDSGPGGVLVTNGLGEYKLVRD